MALMDWDTYRAQAAQENQNMNAMPFVKDPATMSDSPTQNAVDLYGTAAGQKNDLGAVGKTIEQTFRTFLGREPTAADYHAWMQQAANEGNSASDIQQRIMAALPAVKASEDQQAQQARAMSGKGMDGQFGAGMPGLPGSQMQGAFQGGIMGNPLSGASVGMTGSGPGGLAFSPMPNAANPYARG